MAIKVTLDSLRVYVRALDERLRDEKKYPDTWIDLQIDTGYELVSTDSQSFLNEEVLDLATYIADGTAKFEVEAAHDVAGFRQIFITSGNANAIRYTVKPDNKIVVDLAIASLDSTAENLITFQYYYFPRTDTGDQYFSTDIYSMVKYGIASAIYDSLHDYEKRDNFNQKLEISARSVVNGWDYFGNDVVKSNWSLV